MSWTRSISSDAPASVAVTVGLRGNPAPEAIVATTFSSEPVVIVVFGAGRLKARVGALGVGVGVAVAVGAGVGVAVGVAVAVGVGVGVAVGVAVAVGAGVGVGVGVAVGVGVEVGVTVAVGVGAGVAVAVGAGVGVGVGVAVGVGLGLAVGVGRTTYVSGAEPTAPGALAVRAWLPSARALVATLKLPSAAAVPLPTGVVPSRIVTVAPAGAPVPVTVGVAFVEGEPGVVPLMTRVDWTT